MGAKLLIEPLQVRSKEHLERIHVLGSTVLDGLNCDSDGVCPHILNRVFKAMVARPHVRPILALCTLPT